MWDRSGLCPLLVLLAPECPVVGLWWRDRTVEQVECNVGVEQELQ